MSKYTTDDAVPVPPVAIRRAFVLLTEGGLNRNLLAAGFSSL